MELNNNAFFIPADHFADRTAITLSKPISALQLVIESDGSTQLGLLAQLLPGTKVVQCGEGFNDRTVKVRAAGKCYFVFLQDLDAQPLVSRN